jgi:hypothetical protein
MTSAAVDVGLRDTAIDPAADISSRSGEQRFCRDPKHGNEGCVRQPSAF